MVQIVKTTRATTSDDIKLAVLRKFRFDKYFALAATEVKYCDVLASDEKGSLIVEVEVKISFEDFLEDFAKEKHRRYAILEGLVPDYFFFAVPVYMVTKVLEYLNKSQFDHYGVMSYDCEQVTVIKKARRMKVSDAARAEFFRELMLRSSSQIIGLYEANEQYKAKYGRIVEDDQFRRATDIW